MIVQARFRCEMLVVVVLLRFSTLSSTVPNFPVWLCAKDDPAHWSLSLVKSRECKTSPRNPQLGEELVHGL